MARLVRLVVAAALVLALGAWSKPQQLETAPVRGAALAGDGHGHRVAAWVTDTSVRVALADAGRDLGPARTLASAEGGTVQLAVGPGGDALVVWFGTTSGFVPETGDGCCLIIRAALVSRAGRVTGPVTLTDTASRPATNTISVVTGAGSRGRFGVAWSSPDPDSRFARMASIRHGFGAVERVPGGGLNRLLSFDRGHVRLLSLSVVGSPELQEVSRDKAGRWSGPTSLLPADGALFGADAGGRQIGAVGHDAPTELGVRAPPGALRHSALDPAGNPEARTFPFLDVAWSGAAVVVWLGDAAPPSYGDARVRIRRPGRRFGPISLAYQMPPVSAIRDVAVAPDGSVAIAMDVYPRPVQPVVLLRPDGSVRSADGPRTSDLRYVSDVLADSHGAATLLRDRSAGAGLWASRAHW